MLWIAMLVCALAVMPAPAMGVTQTIPPTDIATGAADPSETSARVLGYFNYGSTYPPGIAEHCWFEYGTTVAYGSREDAICSGTTRATLAPLVPGTTYHYRAAASNSAGTTYGPDKTFTTLGSPPGTAVPPPGSTPQATLAVVSGQSLASVLRRGLRLRVTLGGPCPCVIRGRLVVSRSTAKRLGIKSATPIALGRGEYAAPGVARATLKLRSSVKRKLRRIRALKATAKVTVTGASGRTIAVSRSLRLKRTS
jgi:hypothetical protein